MMKSVEHYLSLNYPISIYKDDEGDYVAEVDDLRGCVADGANPSEAFENARAAMRAWIESRLKAGLGVPEPRADEEFRGKVLLRMPRWLHRRLAREARAETSSLNQYMVSLLADRCATPQMVSSMPALYNWGVGASPMISGQFFVAKEMIPVLGTYNVWKKTCEDYNQVAEVSNAAIPSGSAKQRNPVSAALARSQMVA